MKFKQGDLIGGRFEVVDLLGQGGVGVVYGVNDRTNKNKVALKVLRPEVAGNRLALERFMREVKTVRQIDHSGIAQVHDTGRIGDVLFYTMEWIQGDDIHARIKKEKRFAYPGFGTFTVRARKARTGRNPQTGEAIKIKASKTVGFKPAPTLKNTL